MNKLIRYAPPSNQTLQYGFTLLELIVVIIIIGVLAVTVLPRFTDSRGYEEYTYRSEIITKLRSIQLRAMQEQNPRCVALNLTHFGEPSTNPCTSSFTFANDYASDTADTLEIKVQPSHSVTFSMKTGSVPFSFDKWGRPTNGCSGGCEIEIKGSEPLIVAIESEGFIHAL